MSDHDALLATILAYPDDDLPRLVFADWLEESGHPAHVARAQFIRLQIEAAKPGVSSAEALKLLRDSDALRPSFLDEAGAVLDKSKLLRSQTAVWRRGFLDELRGTPETILPNAAPLAASSPLRVLHFESVRKLGTHLKSAEWVTALRELRLLLGFSVRAHSVRQLAADQRSATHAVLECTHLTSLQVLHLSGCRLDDAWTLTFVSHFFLSPLDKSLRMIDLSNNPELTDASANAFAAARGFDHLGTLRLSHCGITPAGAAVLRNRFGDRVVV